MIWPEMNPKRVITLKQCVAFNSKNGGQILNSSDLCEILYGAFLRSLISNISD